MWGLGVRVGFRAWGLGLRGLGFRGLGFRGLGFQAYGLELRVWDFNARMA